MTLDAPARTRPHRLRWLAPVVGPGVLLALLYSLFGTWSVGQGFGGYGDDGGFVDLQGRPTSTPPPVVDVQGHPALWVVVVLAAILVAAAAWASRADDARAARRLGLGFAAAVVFLTAVVVVFTVVQGQLVQDAFGRGDQHPPILGNATVTVSRMPPG